MASILQSNLAWLTARAGVLRAGTGRAGAAPKVYEMKADNTGQIIWNRNLPGTDDEGDPGAAPVTVTTVRE